MSKFAYKCDGKVIPEIVVFEFPNDVTYKIVSVMLKTRDVNLYSGFIRDIRVDTSFKLRIDAPECFLGTFDKKPTFIDNAFERR